MQLTKGMSVRILPGARPSVRIAEPGYESFDWLRDNVGAVVTVRRATPDHDGDVTISDPDEPDNWRYVLPAFLGPVDATADLDDVRAGVLGEEEPPAAPAAPTYAERVQALRDAIDTFKNVRGFHDGLSPEKALTVAAFLLGEAPR